MNTLFKAAAALMLAAPLSLSAFDLGAAMDSASAVTGQSVSKTAETPSLVDTLTQTLGVTPAQATGGTAALLNEAKGNMDSASYSSLLSSVPGLSAFTGGTSLPGASLAQQFSALGMESGMIGKFIPVLLDYVKSEGGSEAMNLLKNALGG